MIFIFFLPSEEEWNNLEEEVEDEQSPKTASSVFSDSDDDEREVLHPMEHGTGESTTTDLLDLSIMSYFQTFLNFPSTF